MLRTQLRDFSTAVMTLILTLQKQNVKKFDIDFLSEKINFYRDFVTLCLNNTTKIHKVGKKIIIFLTKF